MLSLEKEPRKAEKLIIDLGITYPYQYQPQRAQKNSRKLRIKRTKNQFVTIEYKKW